LCALYGNNDISQKGSTTNNYDRVRRERREEKKKKKKKRRPVTFPSRSHFKTPKTDGIVLRSLNGQKKERKKNHKSNKVNVPRVEIRSG